MQPVQFQCGHCGKLMAVSAQYLGKQVRCPHCQQVVVAPPPAPTHEPPEEKTEVSAASPPPGLEETLLHTPGNPAEDIFSPAGAGSDLFSLSESPRLEMPLETLPPTLPGDNANPPQEPEVTLASTMPWMSQPSADNAPASGDPFEQSESTAVLPGGMHPWPGGALTETLQPPPPAPVSLPSDGETSSASARAVKRTEEAKAPWFLLLVFCPLLLYSIVITIFAFFIYRHEQQLQERLKNPFEMMPDVGDDPGVRKGKKVSVTDKFNRMELVTLPLPDSLCTTLGKSLRIGDLQITPNRIERRRVLVVVESARPEPCPHDSLVLYLDMKNLSSDYAFAPLDNYFDRHWRQGMGTPPLTLLEVGDRGEKYRCYGGPAHWYPRNDPANRREWVKGRHDQADLLQPGEEKQMFVCTDGYDDAAAAVLFGEQAGDEYHGRFLWRIRVRRGLVHLQDKDYSATAVIGVRFSHSDIRQASAEVQ